MKWIAFFTLLFVASPAASQEINLHQDAEATPEASVELGLGARIGGYGFRHVNEEGNLDWDNCRMNGTGAFLTVEYKNFYSEAALDLYHAVAEPVKSGIDRISLHSTLALGARFRKDKLISPLVTLGGGAEFSDVEVYGTQAFVIAPVAFVGAGGELNFSGLKLGMMIRSNAMQLPVYNSTRPDEIEWETEISGQALFTARYVFQ